MQEYDVIKSTRDLNENVPKGSIGTVLIILSASDYEVEFVDQEGDTLDVITVPENDIVKYNSSELI